MTPIFPSCTNREDERASHDLEAGGQISYKVLGFIGDDDVKKDVIARYLQAETESQKDNTQFAINQTNYKFRYKGSLQINDQRDYLFDVKPRHNRVGLFKGEL